jgi:hypothetical protein
MNKIPGMRLIRIQTHNYNAPVVVRSQFFLGFFLPYVRNENYLVLLESVQLPVFEVAISLV